MAKAPKDDEREEETDFLHTRLPRVLGERVDRLMQLSDEGIVSRKAFIAEAVREKLERVESRVMERAGFHAWLAEMEKSGKLPKRPTKR